MARGRLLVVLAAVVVLTASCVPPSFSGETAGVGPDPGGSPPPAPSPQEPPPATAGALEWSAPDSAGFESATLVVPVDHADPGGPTLDLALVRRPADDPAQRIGVLLVNPGGPGASGIDLARASRLLFNSDVLERFDIIGFDPRGVGASTPLVCVTDAELDYINGLDPAPPDPEGRSALVAANTAFAAGCRAAGGALLDNLRTVDVARDMDLIREALGEEQINYLGYSYGTRLGVVYAEEFGPRVRAMVLDGALPSSLSTAEAIVEQAAGFESALNAFLAWCSTQSCDFAGGGDPGSALDDLLAAVAERPLAGDDRRQLTIGYALTGITGALYQDALWPPLARALAEAAAGDGSGLLALADVYNGRRSDGSHDNSESAFRAVSCVDFPAISDEELAQVDAALAVVAPRTGDLFSGPDPCEAWPVPPLAVAEVLRAEAAPPLLVVSTTGDPATPHAWGIRLADELATGVLLTFEGEGHTVYGLGVACVDRVVEDYLIDLALPPPNAVC